MGSKTNIEQDIFARYQLKKVINASGRMTMLGGSTPRTEVIEAVSEGLGEYFEIKDLLDKTGAYIAKLLNTEDAVIVSCASAGIAQSVAALITKDDDDLLYHLHSSVKKVPREIIVPKGHNVNFGAPIETMINLGGGTVVEAGYANECSSSAVETCINENTAAILYVKSHHCVQKSMLSISDAINVAKKYNIPLIVDAAAEEDLVHYYEMGADIVIYSGTKALESATSGLVVGKKKYIHWVKKQANGIGRAMKIGREGVLGLTLAIELYLHHPISETGDEMIEKMSYFIDSLNGLQGITAKVVWDSAGRDIARTEIYFDPKLLGKTAVEIVSEMKQGDTAIYFREYRANDNYIEVDVRSVSKKQLEIIYNKLKNIIEGI